MKNQYIAVVRGTTNVFGITITDDYGRLFTLESGQVLVFGVKRKLNDEERLFVKPIKNSVNGEYYLELAPADTASLECGKYYYDVGLQHGASVFHNIIEASVFEVKPNITKLGDGG